MLNWFAVRTRSNFEGRVEGDLIAKGAETLLPTYTRCRRRFNGGKVSVYLPVFPGYVFVHMAPSKVNHLMVLATVGTVRVLGSGENMEPIPDGEMEPVRRLVESAAPLSPHSFLKAGDRVLVKRGPLAGVEGFLIRLKNQTRIVISINLLSESVSAEVDIDDVEQITK